MYRRRRFKRRYRKYRGAGVKALREVRKLKKEVRPEMKAYDVAVDLDPYSGNPDVDTLNDIAQGDGDDQRVGDTVTIRSVQIKGKIVQNVDTADTEYYTRIVVVQEKSPQGTAATWLSVFAADTVDTLRSRNRPTDFRIIWDKTYRSMKDTAQGVIRATTHFKMFKKLNLKTEYNDSATPPQIGGLYIMATSNVPATGNLDLTCNTRVRYTDV